MAAKIFAIANQKGGVGKTTTAVNLAAGLARRRIRTVLVDMDQQASATSALGYEKSLGGSLYQVLHGEGSARDKLIQTQRQNLWLIPSETDMSAIEVELSGEENYLVRLRDCLKPLKESGDFDAIVIDAPPSLGLAVNEFARRRGLPAYRLAVRILGNGGLGANYGGCRTAAQRGHQRHP